MVALVTISERDLRTLLGIIRDDRSDLPDAGLPVSLLGDLISVVRCDVAAFIGLDSGRQAVSFGQNVPAGESDGDTQAFWAHY